VSEISHGFVTSTAESASSLQLANIRRLSHLEQRSFVRPGSLSERPIDSPKPAELAPTPLRMHGAGFRPVVEAAGGLRVVSKHLCKLRQCWLSVTTWLNEDRDSSRLQDHSNRKTRSCLKTGHSKRDAVFGISVAAMVVDVHYDCQPGNSAHVKFISRDTSFCSDERSSDYGREVHLSVDH
jgi:hypothetical protein